MKRCLHNLPDRDLLIFHHRFMTKPYTMSLDFNLIHAHHILQTAFFAIEVSSYNSLLSYVKFCNIHNLQLNHDEYETAVYTMQLYFNIDANTRHTLYNYW